MVVCTRLRRSCSLRPLLVTRSRRGRRRRYGRRRYSRLRSGRRLWCSRRLGRGRWGRRRRLRSSRRRRGGRRPWRSRRSRGRGGRLRSGRNGYCGRGRRSRRTITLAASSACRGQVKILQQPVVISCIHGRAERRGTTLVFHTEDSLVLSDKGAVASTFAILITLFVERPVEVANQIGNLINIILQTNRQTVIVSQRGLQSVVGELISGRHRETRAI